MKRFARVSAIVLAAIVLGILFWGQEIERKLLELGWPREAAAQWGTVVIITFGLITFCAGLFHWAPVGEPQSEKSAKFYSNHASCSDDEVVRLATKFGYNQ